MNRKARQELIGIGALVVGLFLGLTLLRLPITGSWGERLGSLLWRAFGLGSMLVPVLGVGWALAAFQRLGSLSAARAAALGAGLIVLLPYGIGTVIGARFPSEYAAWTPTQQLVGAVPAALAHGVHHVVGTAGGVLVGVFALSALGILTVGWHPLVVLRTRETGNVKRETEKPGRAKRDLPGPTAVVEEDGGAKPAAGTTFPVSRFPKERKPKGAESPRPAHVPPGVLIPPIDLLNPAPPEDGEAGLAQIEQMGHKLIETLQTFRVEGSIAGRTVGPVVTQYEVAPGPGVKVGRIAALADDLALAMRAQSLRIVAPIPGKAAVGIEVPNPMPRMVHIRELIEGDEYHRGNRVLPVALGKNLEGDPVVADLAKMPHLLIAGATGSGKSVCINTIITALLYRYPPEELRLLMIDPKMVELSMYNALPHLRHPVVTNNQKAATALKWAVREMERRYQLFHANHARNIADFNRKVREGKPLKGQRETLATPSPGFSPGVQQELPFDAEYTEGLLPYIVVILDELADLMMTVQHEVETPLATLAQKARAVGIHLILATQRPSVNVITGLIKANFSCRVAFRVASKVDSRTILDQNGAETLLGNGDMLFLPPGKSELVRIQGAFISTDETERLMAWYTERRARLEQRVEVDIIQQMERIAEAEKAGEEGRGKGERDGERDPLFRQAAEVCIQNQIGSTSLLQRRMSIGYGRAARIIDQLEMAGILGPANGSKPRDVLVGLEELDELCGPLA
jgi:S-DNA-T family DNA segregation ATPase FtsK/SpoIIIE